VSKIVTNLRFSGAVVVISYINSKKTNVMKKVWIEDGCTACGLCEDLCPGVFEVNDLAEVKKDADLEANSDCIMESAESCPVEVIKYE